MSLDHSAAGRAASQAHVLWASTALGLILACSASKPGQAQPAAATQLPPISVQAAEPSTGENYRVERSASTKLTEPLRETPKSITVIPAEIIRDRGATSLTETLRTVPGISLGAGEGGIPAGDRTFIRGYDARGDIFVDGVRDFGNYFRDPFNLEQVEIIKGPSSAYIGRGSTGGTINQVTKTPGADAFYAGSATFGTDMTKRATADVNQPLGHGIAVRLNAMVHDADVAGRDSVEQQRWGVAPSLTFGLGSPTQLTLSYLHQEQDNIPDYGHPFDPNTFRPIDVDRDNFYGLVDRDFDEADVDMATARIEHAFSDAFHLQSQLRYGETHRNFIVTKPEYQSPQEVRRSMRSRYSDDTIIAYQTNLTAAFATGGLEHRAVVGVELARETSKTRSRSGGVSLPAADFDHPDPDDTFSVDPAFTGARNRGKVETVGLYVFDTIEIGDRFEVNGGLRWDRIASDYDQTAADGTRTTRSRTDEVLNWQAGLVYKPLPHGSVYVAFGSSSNPSAEYLTLSDRNEDIEPERTESYELGTKWDLFDERLSVTAAIFRSEKTNARIDDPLGGNVQVLDGKQRVDGFEAGISGAITDEWRIFAGYTFLDSEILKSDDPAEEGNRFGAIPKHSASLWTTYRVTREWELGFGAQYVSRRYANASNTFELPSYWRFDAMAAYDVTDNVRVQLNVLNFTDETIYDSAHSSQHALVAPGATALLTTSVRF